MADHAGPTSPHILFLAGIETHVPGGRLVMEQLGERRVDHPVAALADPQAHIHVVEGHGQVLRVRPPTSSKTDRLIMAHAKVTALQLRMIRVNSKYPPSSSDRCLKAWSQFSHGPRITPACWRLRSG